MNASKTFNKYRLYRATKIYTFLLLGFIQFSVVAQDSVNDLAKPIDTSNVLVVTLGLMFVLGLFFLLVYLLKKIPSIQRHNAGVLKILDTLYLGTNEKILLVDVGTKQIVVGVNSQSINTLYVMEESVEMKKESETHNLKDTFSKVISEKLIAVKNS